MYIACPWAVRVEIPNQLIIYGKYSTYRRRKLKPEQVTPGSSRKAWWLCSRGHEWDAVISSRNLGRGCPFCSGRFATEEDNFAIKFPDLAKQWHPSKNGELHPHQLKPHSNKKVWWTCDNGHEWKTTVAHRKEGTNCPECYRRRSS